ncbi:MAG: hypothetical protein KA473_02495 [Anaerolineales bacterium]|nr:hypothetical protein [Anaerolineales bacterium]MBP6208277.1 hypothetical protein [Anaerolineales bacterium]MBP8163846.1 hypothetical protein [Anaerolineales bacterium]
MFLETIPDTSNYMIAGFVFTFVVMGIYVFSMYLRNNNLKRDAETLESLKEEKPAKVGKK